MVGRILGGQESKIRREPLSGRPFVREVRDDFGRTSADQFLTGQGGFWEVSYRHEHPVDNPWSHLPRESLESTLRSTTERALEAAGLSGDKKVTLAQLRVTESLLFPRPYLRLEIDPKSGLSDQEVYRAFAAAWPHDQVALPSMLVAMGVAGTKSAGDFEPGYRGSPLKKLFEVGADCFVHVRSEHLDAVERARLKQWARAVKPGSEKQPPARQLLALLSSPTDLSTREGRETLAALKDLKLFSAFWSEGMSLLEARFKPDQLSASAFLYNGHATFAMTSLLPTLNAFRPAATNLWISKSSGTPSAREIIRIQKPTALFAESKFTRGLETGQTAPTKTVADLLATRMRMPQGEWGSQNMIVDKIGPWLQTLAGNLPPQVLRGYVRAIVHNRDDLDALVGIDDKIWGVDFANSEVKKQEARFIGEQFGLMGAREVRAKGWGRIGDVPVVINGFGLLGEQFGHALLGLKMDPKNITVVDPDPAARERAKALGFTVAPSAEAMERKSRALLVNASPGLGVSMKNLAEFGEELIVLSMTSGGKGVDMKGLLSNAAQKTPVEVQRRSQQPIQDLDLEFNAAGLRPAVKARIIAEGLPPNLVDEMWGDRYQLTSMGVSAAALQAAELTEPGIKKFDPQLDRALLEAAERSGLFELRPLDARPGENQRDLLADLRAFTPSKI